MKNWRRVLIGTLLILNALPYTLDRSTRLFAPGFAFILAGLTVLFSHIPTLREFTWLDALRSAAAGACFAAVVFLYEKTVAVWIVLLSAALLLLLFLPWRTRSRQRLAADHALEDLDELRGADLISGTEREKTAEALERRVADKGG